MQNKLEQNKANRKFLLELEEELPVALDLYMVFIKNLRIFNTLRLCGGYLTRQTLVTYLQDSEKLNINTAKALLKTLVDLQFLGNYKTTNFNILYLKSRAYNCLTYYLATDAYDFKVKRITESRINNTGLIRNLLLYNNIMRYKHQNYAILDCVKVVYKDNNKPVVSNNCYLLTVKKKGVVFNILLFLYTGAVLWGVDKYKKKDIVSCLSLFNKINRPLDHLEILSMYKCNSSLVQKSWQEILGHKNTTLISFDDFFRPLGLVGAKQVNKNY